MSKIVLLLFTVFYLNCSFTSYSTNNLIDDYYISVFQIDKDIFNKEKLKDSKTDDDYDYSVKQAQINWWSEFKEWLSVQWRKIFGQSLDSSFWLFIYKVLPYLILGAAIVFLIWFIVRSNPGNQIMRQHEASKVTLTDEEELLMKQNLDLLASKAIEKNEYRLAIRYLYLNCIKRLDLKGIIDYANEKTNFEYIREIKFDQLSQEFKQLTIAYEQTWYGQMQFDDIYFQKLRQQFEIFHQYLDQKQYAQV